MDSRTEAFGAGSSLDASSASFNAAVPHAIAPTSVLQQYMPSPNGMSDTDGQRRLMDGSMRPSPNGSDEKSSEEAFTRKMVSGL